VSDPGAPQRTQHSVRRRVFVGTASNMVTQALLMVVNLALAPLLIHELGATTYGLWVLVLSISSITGLLDIGMSAALVKYVAEYDARGDRREAARIVGAAAWLYIILGALGAAIIAGLAFVLPGVLNVPEASRETATLLLIGVALGLLLGLPTIVPTAVLRGLQRFPTVNAIAVFIALCNVALTVIVLVAHIGVLGLAAAAVITSVANLWLAVVAMRRAAPEFALGHLRFDRARLRRLIRFSAPIAVIQIAGRLQLKVDAIVIGAALPIRLLTPYNLAQRLAEGTRTVTDQFTRVLLPVATEVATARSAAEGRVLLLTATRLTLLLALAVATPLILLGGQVLEVWVGPEFRPYGDVVALLAASAVIDVSSYPGAATLQSMERHKPLAWMSLLSGVVNLALSIVLVHTLGVRGVALATCSTTAAEILLLVLPYIARVTGISARAGARDVAGRLAPAVIAYVALLEAASHAVAITSIPRLALVVIVGLCGYALVYVCLGATRYERHAYRSVLGRLPGLSAA
jgi:O-antigen/teichoic acid export membrane protein